MSIQDLLLHSKKDTRKLQHHSHPYNSFGNSERSEAKDKGFPGPAHGYKLKSEVRKISISKFYLSSSNCQKRKLASLSRKSMLMKVFSFTT